MVVSMIHVVAMIVAVEVEVGEGVEVRRLQWCLSLMMSQSLMMSLMMSMMMLMIDSLMNDFV